MDGAVHSRAVEGRERRQAEAERRRARRGDALFWVGLGLLTIVAVMLLLTGGVTAILFFSSLIT